MHFRLAVAAEADAGRAGEALKIIPALGALIAELAAVDGSVRDGVLVLER